MPGSEGQQELTIVSAVAGELAQAENARSERLKRFIAQFDLETIPACNEGMDLLLAFSEAHPGAYELALQRSFLVSHPMYAVMPKWKAFAQHVSTCAKCNEA